MKERLQKFMDSERLTSSRLAEILGVQPSNISHILGGRNKPSFEFIEKMLLRFPKINPDWLLLGKGPLYRTEIRQATTESEEKRNAPIDRPDIIAFSENEPEIFDEHRTVPTDYQLRSTEKIGTSPRQSAEAKTTGNNKSANKTEMLNLDTKNADDIDYIVVFFKDKSFMRYLPR